MRRVHDLASARRAAAEWRRLGHEIAFVPTMGAIHEGHLSLVRRARATSDRVVVSIFVNPLQFGPNEDYRRYPRSGASDRALLNAEAVDLLWEPEVKDIYAADDSTRVRVPAFDQFMEAEARPGHFEGVATVVVKLLNVIAPDVLWLGQKDAQQARLLEQMARDLLYPVRIRRGATAREPDGLACSSRNLYLDPEERAQAVALSRGLAAALRLMRDGERQAARIKAAVRSVWREFPKVQEDYVTISDARTFKPVGEVRGRVLVAVAARVGTTRLIDNLEWEPR